jgi:hypothetical protein
MAFVWIAASPISGYQKPLKEYRQTRLDRLHCHTYMDKNTHNAYKHLTL